MHIFKPWEKVVHSCIKIGMKLYKELCLVATVNRRSENDKIHKEEKVTKIYSRIISNPHAHLHTMEKNVQSFKNLNIKLYEELRSQGTHCLYTEVEERLSSQSGKGYKK